MRQYQKELCEYKKSPLKATEAPVKPKLPTWQDYKKEFNAIRKEKYPFTYEVTNMPHSRVSLILDKQYQNTLVM